MSEILEKRPIVIREDYVDATERVALLAEKILHGEVVSQDDLARKVERWRLLRKILE